MTTYSAEREMSASATVLALCLVIFVPAVDEVDQRRTHRGCVLSLRLTCDMFAISKFVASVDAHCRLTKVKLGGVPDYRPHGTGILSHNPMPIKFPYQTKFFGDLSHRYIYDLWICLGLWKPCLGLVRRTNYDLSIL